MKYAIATALLFLAAAAAHADYECQDYNNESDLSVKQNFITHFGDTLITLTKRGGPTTTLYGAAQSPIGVITNDRVQIGILMNKQVIDIYPFQGDSLTLVSQPQFCGRAGCDPISPTKITAKLKLAGLETLFTCQTLLPHEPHL